MTDKEHCEINGKMNDIENDKTNDIVNENINGEMDTRKNDMDNNSKMYIHEEALEMNNKDTPTNPENHSTQGVKTKITRKQCLVMLASFLIRGYKESMGPCFGLYYVQFLWYFDATPSTASGMRTLEQVFTLVVGTCLGIQLDVIQPRFILVGSLVTVSMGLLSASFAPDITTLTLLYGIIYGSGNACVGGANTCIAQLNCPGNSFLASTVEMLGSSVGLLIAPVTIQFLIDHYGWRWALRFHGIIALNLAAISWLLRTPQIPETHHVSFCQKFTANIKGVFYMFTDGLFLLFTISTILVNQAPITMLTHTASRMVGLGYSVQVGSMLLMAFALGNLISRLLTLSFMGRANAMLLSTVARCLSSSGVILCLLNNSLPYQFAMMFLTGIGIGIGTPLITVINVELMGLAKVGRTSTVFTLDLALGIALGATLSAYLYEISGSYTLPFLLAGSTGFLSAFMLLGIYFIKRCKNIPDADAKQDVQNI